MKLLRESKTMDEVDEWGELYTLVNDKGTVIAKYTCNDIIFPDADVRQVPFRAIVEELIGLGYHLFKDDPKEWENSIEESWFMQHELKELELPKPEYAHILHIGWMLMDSSYSGFYCACQNPKKFDIILKSAVPFLCPLCNKKRERWYGIDSYLEDWLIKDGISLDSEYMKKWIINLMQCDEGFVKESFVEFLDKTHFNPDKVHYDYGLVRETLSKKDAGNLMKLFEKDIRDG
jgi:hypothetical protein